MTLWPMQLLPQDSREQVGPERAAAFEAALAVAFPGAPVAWQSAPQIRINGEWKEVTAPGFLRLQAGDSDLVVSAVEFPGEIKRAADKVEGFQTAGSDLARTRLIAVRIGAVLSEQRAGVLDTDAEVTQCDELVADDVSVAWPVVRVSYSAIYRRPNWIASIGWVAKIDTGNMTTLERIPVLSRRRAQGGAEVLDDYAAERREAGLLVIRSLRTGRTTEVDCSRACSISVDTLLGP